MGQHFQKALKLLAEGDIKGTQAIHDELDDAISAIEEDRDLISEMIDRYQEDQPSGKPKIRFKQRKFTNRPERSAKIKEKAKAVAEANGGKASVDEVAKAMTDAGYDLETPVPGTMIGNVLNKDENWKRLEKGVFQYVG